MRSAEANDYWKKVYSDSRRYSNYIKELYFNNCNEFTGNIEFTPGITVICGLNGAGKSSIIASIKELLGLSNNSVLSKNKFSGQVSAKVSINRDIKDISLKSSAIENGLNTNLIRYVDSDQALECLKYWDQSNMDELLESEDDNSFSKKQLQELSLLVGKEYVECVSYEISDEEKEYIPVFFKVKEDSISYDSIGMGIGEHFILYMYYVLEKIENNSILIIEEPESYISVLSQQHLMNYIAKIISEKHISVVISSHSPHILKMIRKESIRIVINLNGQMLIYTPDQGQEAEKILGIEHKKIDDIIKCEQKIATLFVEDYAARIFLDCVLNEESPYINNSIDIVSLNGESDITSRLAFDDSKFMSHKFIGIYDGDMKDKVEKEKIYEKIHWPFLFLPIKECIEKEIVDFLRNNENAKALCLSLNVRFETLLSSLSKRNGEDHHDRFLNICKDIEQIPEDFIVAFYVHWKNRNKENITDFVKSIEEILIGKKSDASSITFEAKEFATIS